MYRVAGQRTLGAAVCVFLLFNVMEGPARSDTESPTVILTPAARGLVVGPGMNAAGRDVRGCAFITQDLSGAVFDGCNLYGVRIDGCILTHASFRGAVFTGACVEVHPTDEIDFTNATINGVTHRPPFGTSRFWQSRPRGNFFGWYGMDLTPQQLISTWSYKNKDLYQCRIRGSYGSQEPVALDLRGADLREATFVGDCSKCDITNARISGASFNDSRITLEQIASTWDFRHHELRVRLSIVARPDVATTEKWDFSHFNLTGSDLWVRPSDVDLTDATINDCTIRIAPTKAQLYSTRSYRKGDLRGLRLEGSDLSGFDLSGMNLTDCGFSHCKFAGTNLEDAVITGAWITTDKTIAESDQLTIAQIQSTWNYKHRHMEGVRVFRGTQYLILGEGGELEWKNE